MLNSFFIIKQICATTHYFIILPKNNTYEKNLSLYHTQRDVFSFL